VSVFLGRTRTLVRELRRFERHMRVCGGCHRPVGNALPGNVGELLAELEASMLPWTEADECCDGQEVSRWSLLEVDE
jgi:hypothetical protein